MKKRIRGFAIAMSILLGANSLFGIQTVRAESIEITGNEEQAEELFDSEEQNEPMSEELDEETLSEEGTVDATQVVEDEEEKNLQDIDESASLAEEADLAEAETIDAKESVDLPDSSEEDEYVEESDEEDIDDVSDGVKKSEKYSVEAETSDILNSPISTWYENYKYTIHEQLLGLSDGPIKCIEIKKYIGDDEEITIPATALINNYNYHVYLSGHNIFNETDIKSVIFENNGRYYGGLSNLFSGCSSLTSVNFNNATIIGGDENAVSSTFSGCVSLQTVDLSKINIQNVIDLSGMFSGCTSLKNVTFGNVFSQVESMNHMFSGCTSLESMDFLNISFSNLSNMNGMFQGCSSLKSVNFNGSVFQSLSDVSWMFAGCISLESIKVSFPNSRVKYIHDMFSECKNLKYIDLGDLDFSNVRETENNVGLMVGSSNNLEVQTIITPNALNNSSTLHFNHDNIYYYRLNDDGSYTDEYYNDLMKCPIKTKLATKISLNYEDYAKVTLSTDKILYDGTEKKPEVSVSFNNVDLVEGTDFEVVYPEDITSVGTKSISIRGINSYDGTITGYSYRIYRNSISDANISLSFDKILYDGAAHKPDVSVSYNGSALVEGTDYEIIYPDDIINEGNKMITIKGINTFEGTVYKSFSIYKNSLSNKNVSLSFASAQYDGTMKKPSVIVKFGNKTLKENADYSVSYPSDMVNAGKKTIHIIGKGQYANTVSVDYVIKAISLENADVSLKYTIYKYSGSAKKPTPTVKFGRKILQNKKDYKVSYKNNVDEGTAYCFVTGIGNYKDILKVSFVILPYSPGMESLYTDGAFITSKCVYGIIDDDDHEVELCAPASTNVSSITVPATVTNNGIKYKVISIGTKAFYKNSKLKTLSVGNNVKSIENYAFYGCKNLSTVKLGKSVDLLGSSSFRQCTKLTSLTLPVSLDKLGNSCFYGCKKLRTITINAKSVVDIEANAITGISTKAVIKVPKKFFSKYKKKFTVKVGFKKTMKLKKK